MYGIFVRTLHGFEQKPLFRRHLRVERFRAVRIAVRPAHEIIHAHAEEIRERDEHGAVDIRYELENTFFMPIHLLVVDVYYALPFGKIYGFVKDTNGKKYVVDGMLGIGEDKSTRM